MTGISNTLPTTLDFLAVPSACVILQHNGTIQQVNTAAARLLGVGSNNLAATLFAELVLAGFRPTFTALLQETAVSPHRATAEIQLSGAGGQPVWVRLEAGFLPATKGVCLILIDIDAYKQNEIKGQQQAQLLNNISDAIVTTDPNYIIRSWNKGAESMYGWSAAEAVGTLFPDLVPTRYLDMNREQTLSSFIQEGYWQGEVMQQTKEGRPLYILSTAAWLRDNNDNLIGTMAINRDITKRKQAEEKMRQNETRLQALIENAPDGITLLDQEGRFLDVSPSASRILGYTPHEMLKHNPIDYLHPDDLPQLMAIILELQAEPDGTRQTEYRVRHADGSWRYIESTITNLLHEPAIKAFVFNYRDVTDRKQAQSRYRLLVEKNPAVIYLDQADELGTNYYISPQVENLLGYPAAAYGQNPTLWHDQIFPEDYREAIDSIRIVLKEGQASAEYRMIRRDGRIVWVRDSSVLVHSEDGQSQFIQGFLEDITERKQAEEALKESETFLQATLDALSAHIAILDQTGNILAVNEAWRTFGRENNFTLENAGVGSSYLQPVDQAEGKWAAEAPAVAKAIRALIAGEIEEAHIEYPCHSPTEKRWFITHITRFAQSERPRVVVAHENITARKLAETSLRETKNLLEKVFVSLHEAVFVINPQDRTIVTCNAAVEPIFGYTPEELIGQSTRILYHSQEDFQQFATLGDPILDQTGAFKTEYRMRRKDGQSIITENTVSSLNSQTEWQSGVVSLVRDITARKEAEMKLRESEERFRILIENAPGAITLLGSDGTLKFISASTERVMGYRPQEALGANPAEFTHPDDLPALLDLLQDLLQKPGAVRRMQYRFKHKDGSWRWVESSISNLLHIPAVEAISFNFQDINERKHLENELHERVTLAEFQGAIGAALVEIGDLPHLLQKCAQAVVENFGAAFACIWTLNDEEQILELQASAGHTRLDGEHGPIPVDGSKITHISPDQQPYLSNDIAHEPFITDPDWVQREGLVAFAGYPLLVEKRLVGTLALFARHLLTAQHLQAMGTIANNIALVIERKRNEKALQQSRDLLQIAGETARLGGWIVNLETDHITWSDEVCAIHEVPPGSSPTQEEVLSYYTPPYRSRIKTIFAACAGDGTPYDEEMQIITAKGRPVWIRTIGRAVRDAAGKIVRVQGAFQDITERKEIENLLSQSQQRFRQLADAMPLVVWTAAADGSIDYGNQFFNSYTGANELNLTVQEWLAVLHPDDVEHCLREWSNSVQTGEPFNIEYRIRRHDGSYHWHLVKATPIRNEEGHIIKWYGTATDIHQHRMMEEEMRRLATRLNTTLESITDAFFTLDHDWRFTYINQEAERSMERTRSELIGQIIWEVFQPAVGTAFYHEFHRALQENQAVAFEEFYPPMNRWFEAHAYPSEEGLAVYFRDITERKQAETQLQDQLEELRRWHKATLGREMRLLDLKQEVNELLRQQSQPPRYPSAESESDYNA
jgi:PAS domain S-box-containing protein